jgi:major membrane immunogen (membrane-anchored lipoprotein)
MEGRRKKMKKTLLTLMIVALVFLTGCTKVDEQGNYKEGTYFGASQAFESYGAKYVSTATVNVGADGKIKSVFIDSTYNKDGINTTKKTLGDDYGMKDTSANIGVIPGGAEWYEQINNLEAKIVEEQGLDWLEWSNDEQTLTDSVSSVTITVDTYYEAVMNALNQAK